MAGYRRFIAYVYDYENGKKGSNCGFIKVEVKDQQCSVEVHLHCPGLPEDVGCRVYGFTRKDGLINGVLLDTCETEKEIVECMIVTDAMDMNASGVSMGKMGGMVITTDIGGFFGTEWDDQPIRPENFREIKIAPADAMPKMVPISNNVDTASEDVASSDIESSSVTAAIQEISLPVTEQAPEILPETMSSDMMQSDTLSPDTTGTFHDTADFGETPEVIEPSGTTMPEEQRKPESSAESESLKNTVSAMPDNVSEPTEAQILNIPEKNTESTPDVSSLHQNRNEHRKPSPSTNPQDSTEFTPFSDGELAAAWKIHLNDLKRFPRHYCSLRNNRFIQYGHYNFGHLLLGQRNNGQYILGVPGGYNQQERFMANMFGFPYFKESRYVEIPKVRGGYWYRLIDAPDSHR